MAEDKDVADGEITPEDFEGEETPKAESSPVKEAKEPEKETEAKKEPEAKKEEAKAEPEAKPDEAEKVEEPEKSEEPKEPKPEDEAKPLAKADERKTQLNTEIRDLVSQRNALKAEVEKANAEVYQPATEDELTAEGMNATDAKVEALRQQIEVRDYNTKVADAQLTISSEAERVLQDFPIFNSESEQYDKELAEEASQLMEANLILDQNTQQVIGSNVSPYQLYKTLARASGISVTKGQLKGQQDTQQMLANADAGSSTAPQKQASDPLLELWKEEL